MPELTWGAALAWFGVIASAASIASLISGVFGVRQTNRLIERTTENTQGILERMDQRADDRQREMMEAIQALKR
jgi:hypothetical protein